MFCRWMVSRFLLSPPGLEENFRRYVVHVLWARCPSCHPTNSVKALKETKKYWPPKTCIESHATFFTFFIHYQTPEVNEDVTALQQFTSIMTVIALILVTEMNYWMCAAMHIAWRERNKDARIKAAKEILEKNPEFVYILFLLLLLLVFFKQL